MATFKKQPSGNWRRETMSSLFNTTSPSNWRDSLITFRDLHKIDSDFELDLMRLMRTAKALKGELAK